MKNLLAAILLTILLTVPFYAQQTQSQQSQKDDDVVKVSTSLVQIDAVVTDKAGNPVTNLTANDFEILQDGKTQTITNLSYLSRNIIIKDTNQSLANKSDKISSLLPIVSNRSTEFGRILTFVVDDGSCDTSFSGITAIRDGLEKFINEQMLPNDSVAIYRTREGSSLLQQYTSDKSQLLRIVRKISWYPPKGIFCSNLTGSDYNPARNDSTLKGDTGTFQSDADKERNESMDNSLKNQRVTGLESVLKYAITGLRPVGGRKILFLMSDALPIIKDSRIYSGSYDTLRELTVLANRSSVVINTIDVRGLQTSSATAEDDIQVSRDLSTVNAVDRVIAERGKFDDSRQSGMLYVASETGGKFYKNMNYLNVPIQKALQSETGYYLIGYQPEGDTFEGKKFHKIEVKLKRPDLNVSSRSGFLGVTDEAMRPKARTGDSELYDALSAPLPNADMGIQLSAYFANTPDKGNFIHAVLYIDGKDITFADDANGNKKAVFDIVAVTLDEKNKVIDDSNHTNTVHIPSDKAAAIRQNGLIYTVDVPVKKDGVYTFRTALRDAAAKRLGSASQVIEIPDLKKNKLLVSGLILSGVDANGKLFPPEAAKTDNEFSTVTLKSIPAIRQFRQNSILGYAYTIYNAKLDANGKPNLSIQTNLYRDGKVFSEGKPNAAQIEAQSDMTRIHDYGYLRLNPNVPLGDYTLQIIIKDPTTNQTTNQSIDFEIVE